MLESKEAVGRVRRPLLTCGGAKEGMELIWQDGAINLFKIYMKIRLYINGSRNPKNYFIRYYSI